MSFGDSLKEARKKAGITQNELANKLHVSAAMIAQYETGKRNPKKDTLHKIANALNLGFSYTKDGEPFLFDFVDTENNDETNVALLGKLPVNVDVVTNGIFENKLISDFRDLNNEGQNQAIIRVEELTQIPKYKKEKK